MRIATQSVEEYLESLQDVTSIFDDVIRISVIRRGDNNGRNSTKFEVILQSTCVVIIPEGGEYLLETGEFCGMDYEDATAEKIGSARAAVLKEQIKSLAKRKGWRTLPGMISE